MKTNVINLAPLLERLAGYCKKAGRMGAKPVLLLFYVLRSPDTPKKEKMLIYSTLAYVILPIDFISAKKLPLVGWLDEIVSIATAFDLVRKRVTPEMEAEAEKTLDRLFGVNTATAGREAEYVDYEIVAAH